jgi:hypothetical protein
MINSYKELFSFDPKKCKQVASGKYYFDISEFCKEVKPRHYMIKEKGYGISEDVIQQLIQLDCQRIRIKSKNNIYLFDFIGILSSPIKNYGHGEQRFLKIKDIK